MRDLGIRAGWEVGMPIPHEIWFYCLQNDIDLRIEAEWGSGVRAIILYHRPSICQEIRRTVLRQ